MSPPPDFKPDSVNRNDLRCTAFHEAGHAVAAAVLGIQFDRVFVVREVYHAYQPVGMQLGQVERNFHLPSLAGQGEETEINNLIQAFSGPMAETFAYPNLQLDMPPNNHDVKDAWKILKFFCCKFTIVDGQAQFDKNDVRRNAPKMESLFKRGVEAAERFVKDHEEVISEVAEALIDRTELTASEVREICDRKTDVVEDFLEEL